MYRPILITNNSYKNNNKPLFHRFILVFNMIFLCEKSILLGEKCFKGVGPRAIPELAVYAFCVPQSSYFE